MIQYDKSPFGLNLVLRFSGSAVYRASILGLFSIIYLILMRAFWKRPASDPADNDQVRGVVFFRITAHRTIKNMTENTPLLTLTKLPLLFLVPTTHSYMMVLIECRFFPSRNEYNYYHQKLLHPYTIGVIVAGTSFLLVFRLQAAYNRYWEAATNVYHMMSKWMDAGTCFRRVAGFSRGLCRFAFASGSSYFRFDLTISLASLSLSRP